MELLNRKYMKIYLLYSFAIILCVFLVFVFIVYLVIRYNPSENFVSYEEEPSEDLISNFGKQEYICTGECFCRDEDEEPTRRSSLSLITRSMTFLLASTTSLIAYHQAKEHFRRQCEEEYSEDSTSCFLEARVKKCTQTKDRLKDAAEESLTGGDGASPLEKEKLQWELLSNEDSTTEKQNIIFECRGYCLLSESIDDWIGRSTLHKTKDLQKNQLRFSEKVWIHLDKQRNKCILSLLQDTITVETSIFLSDKQKEQEYGSLTTRLSYDLDYMIKKEFESKKLRKFCQESGKWDQIDHKVFGEQFEKEMKGKKDQMDSEDPTWCSSYNSLSDYENIGCRRFPIE